MDPVEIEFHDELGQDEAIISCDDAGNVTIRIGSNPWTSLVMAFTWEIVDQYRQAWDGLQVIREAERALQ